MRSAVPYAEQVDELSRGRQRYPMSGRITNLPVICSWSSGKDSAYALDAAIRDEVDVVGLLCVVNQEADRIAMHAVRRDLLLAQANRLDLPVTIIELPAGCTYDEYANTMRAAVEKAASDGIRGIVFGDLFLEHVKRHRFEMLAGTPIRPMFPLWGNETAKLARDMIDSGLRATITCVDPMRIDRSFAGLAFDADFLEELPSTVDPCGENGEFHTFVWDSPLFSSPIHVERGIVVERGGFVFADLAESPSPLEVASQL
jgi:uncharacterized protein (TIGR00290 family)